MTTKQVRVIRKLVITGPEDWVRDTLRNSFVSPGHPVAFTQDKHLEETERYYDLAFEARELPSTDIKDLKDGNSL